MRDFSRPGPVLLMVFHDWDAGVGVRQLYASLITHGHAAKVVQFGYARPTDNTEELLLLQSVDCDFSTNYCLASDEELAELRALVERLNPSLIGMSVMSTVYALCAQVTHSIQGYCDAPIVWGGIHPTLEPEETLRETGIAAVCRGEGEDAIVAMAEIVAAGGSDFGDVPNLCLIDAGGRFKQNDLAPMLQNLDELPFAPLLSEDAFPIPHDRVKRSAELSLGPDRSMFTPAVIMTGLGCPYRCTYCFNEPWAAMYRSRGQQYLRMKSVDRVIRETRHVRDVVGKPFIAFWDDVFGMDIEWLREFAERYPREVGVPFFAYLHPKETTPEVAALLEKAGCAATCCGIQSGSEEYRAKSFHRYETNEEIVATAHELNPRFEASYDVIVDSPYETDDIRRANVELFLQLPHPFKICTNSLHFLPGQSLTRRALADELITADDLCWRKNGFDPSNDRQHLRTPRQHNYYILTAITQHREFARDEIRAWLDDEDLLNHPYELRLRVAIRLADKLRYLYFGELDRRARAEARLAAFGPPAIGNGNGNGAQASVDAATPHLTKYPSGLVPTAAMRTGSN